MPGLSLGPVTPGASGDGQGQGHRIGRAGGLMGNRLGGPQGPLLRGSQGACRRRTPVTSWRGPGAPSPNCSF